MKRAGFLLAAALATLTFAACQREEASTNSMDPHYDGVTNNSLNRTVSVSILEAPSRKAPSGGSGAAAAAGTPAAARTAATTTAPAEAAPAAGGTKPAPSNEFN